MSAAHTTVRPGEMIEELAAEFTPVSLDELNAQAALQTRVDRKYVVYGPELRSLLRGLHEAPVHPQVLEIGGARAMEYRSLYFDTPDLVSYRQSTQRRRRRFKLRTRQYVDTGQAYLEIKRQGSRGETVKDRTQHPFAALGSWQGTADDDVASAVASTGVDPAKAEELAPVLGTLYRRTTILLPGEDPAEAPSRLTIDTDLEWTAPSHGVHAELGGGGPASLAAPHFAVVETKNASGVGLADRLLWDLGVRPTRFTKYCTGLAAMRPELPSSRWSRSLRRHLTEGVERRETVLS